MTDEILTEPPEEGEGDDGVAGGGNGNVLPDVTPDEISDAPPLDEDDFEGDGDGADE